MSPKLMGDYYTSHHRMQLIVHVLAALSETLD